MKCLAVIVLLLLLWGQSFSQGSSFEVIKNRTYNINVSDSLTGKDKLKALYSLKADAERMQLTQDSSFVNVLRSIGYYEFVINNNNALAIKFMSESVNINNTLKERRSQHLACVAYYATGYYYESAKLYRQALLYYDSAVAESRSSMEIKTCRMPARQNKASIYFLLGDYQKSIDDCMLGMHDAATLKDTLQYLIFLNTKTQSLSFQNSLEQAAINSRQAIQLAEEVKDTFELATAYKTHAFILEKTKQYSAAKEFFVKAIKAREYTGDNGAIASDYNDLGNFYAYSLADYSNASKKYYNAIAYAKNIEDAPQRSSKLALAYYNLGDISFKANDLQKAARFHSAAFRYLNIDMPDYLRSNPTEEELSIIEHKELVYGLLMQKTALLLKLYQQEKNAAYLDACLQTALLTDSVFTQTRHEQTAESSKLLWRNNTRQFFTNAIEACWMSKNAKQAFYFMEKSRAVLLNDKLNELGAAANLPKAEDAKEESLQTKIVEAEQALAVMSRASKEYADKYNSILQTREELEQFIKMLEKKYPAYYKYKYADHVPTLDSLQQFLAINNQSFVHYYMNDTVLYVLGISKNGMPFFKLSQKDFDTRQLAAFLNLCTDKEQLKKDNNYRSLFAPLAQNIYNLLFKPLQFPSGAVAICTDNFLIPFEALCTDAEGKRFLLNQYSFNYVYSASTFMKPYVSRTAATGNFIGFAPVAFAPNLQLVSLRQSADSLSRSASYFSHNALFTEAKATRNNFFANASKYNIITIFSHAKADTSDQEPVLYLQDAPIHLSELQLLKNPSARIVLLSACQTNIGKTATGEGIYSLARGFATAGIPAIAGTLWKADDQTIYTISANFNKYLAEELSKSEALRRAKLDFIEGNPNSEFQLPYYWANLVLIGDTQPISLIKESYRWRWISGIVAGTVVLVAVVVMVLKKTRYFNKSKAVTSRQERVMHA